MCILRCGLPELFRIGGIHFFIYSREHRPIHVHIKKAECHVVIEVESLKVRDNVGFAFSDLRELQSVVLANQKMIIEMWHEYFNEGENEKN
jgi:hypothetical protein